MQGKKVSGGVYNTEAEARSAAIQLHAKLHSTQPHTGLPNAELSSDPPPGTATVPAAQQRPCLATSGRKRSCSPDSPESGHCQGSQPQDRVCHAIQALADKLGSSPAQPQHETHHTLAEQGRHQQQSAMQQPPTQQQQLARRAPPVQTGQGSAAKSTGGLKPRDHFTLPPRLRRAGDQLWMRGYRARWHEGSSSWKFHVRFTYWVRAYLADDAISHASATSVILADVDACNAFARWESHRHLTAWHGGGLTRPYFAAGWQEV